MRGMYKQTLLETVLPLCEVAFRGLRGGSRLRVVLLPSDP